MSKIILAGYMGSGKTTVGLNLSEAISIPFFDLDELICDATELSISQIFTEKGEIWFRKKEHELLNKFIQTHDRFILSLGGGTPCYANNHKILQQNDITSVYLKAKVSTLANRLSSELESRPLLKNITGDLASFIGQHLFERTYYYNFCKYIIPVDERTVSSIVNDIILCNQYNNEPI